MVIIRDLKLKKKKIPLPLQILEITQVPGIQTVCSCPTNYIILITVCRNSNYISGPQIC